MSELSHPNNLPANYEDGIVSEGSSYYVPESEILSYLINPSQEEPLSAFGRKMNGLNEVVISDDWEQKGKAHIKGWFEAHGYVYYMEYSISFPSMLARGLATLKRQEPKAVVHYTIN